MIEQLQKEKLELEIAKLKEKPALSKFDKEFLIGAGMVMAEDFIGDRK